MRGVIRWCIEATTPYEACDAVDNDASVIYKAAEDDCDLILLHLTTPLQDSLVTVSVLRGKLPHVKIVGFSALSIADLQKQVSPKAGFDAVVQPNLRGREEPLLPPRYFLADLLQTLLRGILYYPFGNQQNTLSGLLNFGLSGMTFRQRRSGNKTQAGRTSSALTWPSWEERTSSRSKCLRSRDC